MNTHTLFSEPILLSRLGDSPSFLSQSNAIGQGVDVFGRTGPESFITHLLDPNKATTKTFSFGGKEFLIPSYITPIENTSAYYQGGTYMSRDEFQNSLAVNVEASVGYGLFSGEMKATYNNEYSASSEYAYTYNNFYSTMVVLQLGDFSKYLSDNFLSRVEKLPKTVDSSNLSSFVSFFNDFGIYYTDKVELGGCFNFYVSVAKSSQMNEREITAMVKAQYKGLVANGSISADVKQSESWKKYSTNSQYHISAKGGEPALIGPLTNVDPLNPSQDSVNAYSKWLSSVTTSPALTNIRLRGIWLLCGDKKDVVQEAWTRFSSTIHPKISIETSTQLIGWPIYVEPKTPIITLNGDSIKPDTKPISPTGYQIAILSNEGKTPAVLFNQYFFLDSTAQNWSMTDNWIKLYEQMFLALKSTKYNVKDNIIVICSFGLDNNIFPTRSFYEFLKLNGAGDGLNQWEKECNPGSQLANKDSWITTGRNYIVVSKIGGGSNNGVEILSQKSDWGKPFKNIETIFLYKDSVNGKYTIGN